MFCGGTAEATENSQVEVRMDYIQSDSFRVFLRWLYGESFEDACSILRKKTADREEENYDSYYLTFLIDLLRITDMCRSEPLKDVVEIKIMKGCVNINNVVEVLQWAKDCKALKL